jgi:hypothetical protein
MVIDNYAKKYWLPRHQYQIEGTCPVCGFCETKENFRYHQRWHDEVVRIYEPTALLSFRISHALDVASNGFRSPPMRSPTARPLVRSRQRAAAARLGPIPP